MRRTDDATRALVFDLLRWAQVGAQRPDEASQVARDALATAAELLGPAELWLPAYRADCAPGALVVDVLGGLDPARARRALALARATHRERRALRVDQASLAAAQHLVKGTDVAVEARLERGTSELLPAAPGWTAALQLTPAGLDGALPAARAAVAAGAGAVRLAVAPQGWATADLQRLTTTLQQLGAALGDRLLSEAPSLDVVVEPNGDVRVGGERVGHLADLASADRYVRAGSPRAVRAQAARVLASFLAWHAAGPADRMRSLRGA